MICQKCGNEIPAGATYCVHCGQAVQQIAAEKPENVVTGVVGALLGAAIGGGSVILLSQLGYVAALSGLLLAVCTLKGYELLGGRLSKKGIVICLVLMLVTPYIADRLDWAIVLMKELPDITLGEAFAAIPGLIEEDIIEKSSYTTNLLMIYGFAILGAFSTVRGLFRKKK